MDIFTASSIITFFASIGFGLFIYSRDTNSNLGKAWMLLSLSIALWALSLYGVTSSESIGSALKWQYILDFSAIFIPVFYFNFVSIFLGLNNKKVRYIILAVGFLIAFFTLTQLFKEGVDIKFGFYWVNPGQFYFISPLFFSTLVIYTLSLLIKSYFNKEKNELLKDKIKYHILAGIIGFSGGATNFFPQFFDTFPFGNYFIIFYIFFISYSVLRHQLFNVKAITAELLAAALSLIFLFNFLISQATIGEWFFKFIIFILVTFFGILLIHGVQKEVKIRERSKKLAGEISMANKELRRMERQKTEFVSIASHQLRTPLTAIKGYASMLLEGSFGKISSGVREAVEKIYKSNQVLVVIIDDFLMVSRIEQGRMQYDFNILDLRGIIKEVLENVKSDVEEKGLTIQMNIENEGSFIARADYAKMKQVVHNVVNNAIRYTDKGFIKILLSKNKKSKKLRIAISDTGMGIKKEMIPKLFKKFSKGRESKLGSGIGLYVAKEIVNAHKGRIWAQSDGSGHGTTFFIELPEAKKSD